MGRTSVVDREKRRSAEALLQYIGLSPPLKATDSRRAPGSTLTRVNVLNRYLGYKACKYETKWAGRQLSSETLNRPPHIRKVDVSARFSRSGVQAAENSSEVRFFVCETG